MLPAFTVMSNVPMNTSIHASGHPFPAPSLHHRRQEPSAPISSDIFPHVFYMGRVGGGGVQNRLLATFCCIVHGLLHFSDSHGAEHVDALRPSMRTHILLKSYEVGSFPPYSLLCLSGHRLLLAVCVINAFSHSLVCSFIILMASD